MNKLNNCKNCHGSGYLMDASRTMGITMALSVGHFPTTKVCGGCNGTGVKR